MTSLIHVFLFCAVLHHSYGFTKYGRSCKDIGCPSNQVCVMSEDPCSYYNRGECGMYPSCKATGEAASCATHVCPPTQECTLDNGTPKCVAQKSSSTHVHKSENTGGGSPSYPPQNPAPNAPSYPAQNPSYPAQNPSYPAQNPSYPSGSLYPSISTPRPAGGSSYPGYPSQGGSSYPSYPSQGGSAYPSYPSQGGSAYPGYPAQSGYPSYPQQGYNNNNRGGYPQYPNQGYPQYPGYQQPNRGSGSNSGSNPIVDKITDQLKTIGAGLLKNALSNVLSGGNSRQ